jgi:hypothetical protein
MLLLLRDPLQDRTYQQQQVTCRALLLLVAVPLGQRDPKVALLVQAPSQRGRQQQQWLLVLQGLVRHPDLSGSWTASWQQQQRQQQWRRRLQQPHCCWGRHQHRLVVAVLLVLLLLLVLAAVPSPAGP